MKISLSENITKYRKEKGLTQEQLADTLGVSFAAVSKWERGVATPDLSFIVQMANLFNVSLDSLIGFDMESSNINSIKKKIEDLVLKNNYQEAVLEINNALTKFPNNFAIVYMAAKDYYLFGFKLHNKEYISRCIELYEKSITLLSQNTNYEINEISIQGEIALCYIELGNIEKGIETFKKYNVRGLFDPLISYSYTSKPGFNPKEIEPYLKSSITTFINSLVLIATSYSNYFNELHNYKKSIDSLLWLKDVLISLKDNPNESTYFDKLIVYSYAKCATYSELLNDDVSAYEYLKLAYDVASIYDKNPTRVLLNNIKIKIDSQNIEYAEDSLGETGFETCEKVIKKSELLMQKWNTLKLEK